MDVLSRLYDLTGTSDPAQLAITTLIALVLAGGLASLLLEAVRILKEYSGRETPAAAPAPAGKPVPQPRAAPKEKPAEKAPVIAPEKPAAPAIEVVKGTMKESIEALEKKYRLNAVTLSTVDGLVIASTINDPDEEAAVWSGKFNELNKEKPGNYYAITDKGIHLYSAESAGNKVIGVARRTVALEQGEVTGLQDDTRKIVDKFAPAVKKP
ncbi:hypothetical protein [Methanocella sp. MCL-LM]|uniref:hypothetical protein n=1 Tax=Methanocella sp. MCL-LM TaxID=3412035 RepID=UPI003C751710